MYRHLIAIAAATLCAATAHAQTSVTLSGLTDVYVGSMKMAGDADRRSVVNSGGMTTSWFGFTGSEDLGGGLKANFQLTSFIQVDAGTQGRFPGDTFFSRDANVSLSGSFGSVLLGRWMAPNFLPSVVGNPLGDSFTFSPLILHKNVPLFNASGWQATTPSDTGWSNQIAYSTPDIGGFKANLQYQFGELPGDNGKKNVGANFFYFGGPLTLTGYYERDQISNPGQHLPGHDQEGLDAGRSLRFQRREAVPELRPDQGRQQPRQGQDDAGRRIGPAGRRQPVGFLGQDRADGLGPGPQDLHAGL